VNPGTSQFDLKCSNIAADQNAAKRLRAFGTWQGKFINPRDYPKQHQ
jgi:hypothetical protein